MSTPPPAASPPPDPAVPVGEQAAVVTLTDATLADMRASASRSPDEAGRVLGETLEWLRERVVAPVLTALEAAGHGAGRLWWCPTGLLALLPLHAAGELPERYVCSYATTLKSLAESRRRQGGGERGDGGGRAAGGGRGGDGDRGAGGDCAAGGGRAAGGDGAAGGGRGADGGRAAGSDGGDGDDRVVGGVLVVDQADVPGLLPLPFARKEALRLVTQVGERKLLAGPTVDRHAVRKALPHHSCLHFAGHARHDPVRPARSGLFCHGNGRPALLTVEDIARLRLDSAQLAFLSACETARGTARLPDEALHLAGVLQLAGFAHVVAAQWVAEDTTARELTAHFYAELRHPESPDRLDPTRAASALHTAVRRVRQRHRNPLLWAAYVHTGP